jgi:hypothetical protein
MGRSCLVCSAPHSNRVSNYCSPCRKGKCYLCLKELSDEAIALFHTKCLMCWHESHQGRKICYITDDMDY